MIEITPHPAWVVDLLAFVAPYEDRVVSHVIFDDIKKCKLTKERFQAALINFYPLIESFPQFMALTLAKARPENSEWTEKTHQWLITNISQERCHAKWWQSFAKGFGVPSGELNSEIVPPAQMEALNNYLWRICTYGSLAEGMSAANFAVEGATGQWTKSVREGVAEYRNLDWTNITEESLKWIVAHANYDDHHPLEALEIIKVHATTKREQELVKQAAKRSLEYYALALDSCYELFG